MTILGRRQPPAILVIAGVLLALCAVSFASLVAAAAGVEGLVGAPGRFLLVSFSWAGFFVPVYLFCGTVLLVAPVFRRRSALLLMFSIIPFLTLSLILHVLRSPSSALPQLLVDSFGVVPSALLLFLLLALEVIFLLTMPSGRAAAFPRPSAKSPPAPLALPFIAPPVRVAEEPALSPAIPAAYEPPAPPPVPAAPLKPAVSAKPSAPPRLPAREQAELPFPAEAGAQGGVRNPRAPRPEKQGRQRLLGHRR